jgi:hypothetical protein
MFWSVVTKLNSFKSAYQFFRACAREGITGEPAATQSCLVANYANAHCTLPDDVFISVLPEEKKITFFKWARHPWETEVVEQYDLPTAIAKVGRLFDSSKHKKSRFVKVV